MDAGGHHALLAQHREHVGAQRLFVDHRARGGNHHRVQPLTVGLGRNPDDRGRAYRGVAKQDLLDLP